MRFLKGTFEGPFSKEPFKEPCREPCLKQRLARPFNEAPAKGGAATVSVAKAKFAMWEFPEIGNPAIVPYIVGSLVQGPQNTAPLIF